MSDVTAAPDPGQAAAEALSGQSGSFLDVDWGDGKVDSFRSPDEVKKWMKESGLRQSDYTKKTQGLSEQRRKWEEDYKRKDDELRQLQKKIEEQKSKYDRYEEAFKKRPFIAQQLEQMVSRPASPDEIFTRTQGYADEKYKSLEERLQQFEAEREREKLERQRDEIYARMGEKYPDFSADRVNEALSSLEEGNIEPLIEMAWKAASYNPVEMEEKVAEKMTKKRDAKIPGGNGTPPPKGKGSSDPKRALEEAYKDLGIMS